MKRTRIILPILIFYIIVSLLVFAITREVWREGELLNIVIAPSLSVQKVVISVFENRTMLVTRGVQKKGVWGNSLALDQLIGRPWMLLNDKGFWQKMFRGSVRLGKVNKEIQALLTEEEYERVKEYIELIESQEPLGKTGAADATELLINTRNIRYYTYFENDWIKNNEHIMELCSELLGISYQHGFQFFDSIPDLQAS